MTDTSNAPLLPVLFESLPYHNWEEVDLEAVTDAEIAADLAPLTHAECAARGLKHSSLDHHYTATSDADTDEHCRQALLSAGRRCGL
jgi:hypothetical protein